MPGLTPGGGRKAGSGSTPWASASRVAPPAFPTVPAPKAAPVPTPFSQRVAPIAPVRASGRPAAAPSARDFPGLPPSTHAAREAQKAALGLVRPAKADASSWARGPSPNGAVDDETLAAIAEAEAGGAAAARKGKGRAKGQVLFRM